MKRRRSDGEDSVQQSPDRPPRVAKDLLVSSIPSLPLEIIDHILCSGVPLSTLGNALQVNKVWHALLSNQDIAWQHASFCSLGGPKPPHIPTWRAFCESSVAALRSAKKPLRTAVRAGHSEYIRYLARKQGLTPADLSRIYASVRYGEEGEDRDDFIQIQDAREQAADEEDADSGDEDFDMQDEFGNRVNENGCEIPVAIYEACYLGHANVLLAHIDLGVDPNMKIKMGYASRRPIDYASNHASILEILLDKGVHIPKSYVLHQMLRRATQRGQTSIVRQLLPLYTTDRQIQVMLCVEAAFKHGHGDLVHALIHEFGADVEAERMAYLAAEGNLTEWTKHYLEKGISEDTGKEVFLHACRHGNVEILELIHTLLPDAKSQEAVEKTALKNNTTMAYLLSSPLYVDWMRQLISEEGARLLYLAIEYYKKSLRQYVEQFHKEACKNRMERRKQVIIMLLDAGVDPNDAVEPDWEEDPIQPVYFHCLMNDMSSPAYSSGDFSERMYFKDFGNPEYIPYELELMQLLVSKGADGQLANDNDCTFGHLCVTRGILTILEYAIDTMHADPLVHDTDHRSVIGHIHHDSDDVAACVDYLINKYQLELNDPAEPAIARCGPYPKVLRILLQHNADPLLKYMSQTVLHRLLEHTSTTYDVMMDGLDVLLPLPGIKELLIQPDGKRHLPIHYLCTIRQSLRSKKKPDASREELAIELVMRLLAAGYCSEQLDAKDDKGLTAIQRCLPPPTPYYGQATQLAAALERARADPEYPQRLLDGKEPYPSRPIKIHPRMLWCRVKNYF